MAKTNSYHKKDGRRRSTSQNYSVRQQPSLRERSDAQMATAGEHAFSFSSADSSESFFLFSEFHGA